MKTLHYLIGIVLLVGACADAAPTSDAQPTGATTQNASNEVTQEEVDAGHVTAPQYAPLPVLTQPSPPCLSCPTTVATH